MKLAALSSGVSDWQPTGRTTVHTEHDPVAHWTGRAPMNTTLHEYRSDRLNTTAWFQKKDMET